MAMRPYVVTCSRRGCGDAARYKIAARWSDGVTRELKTYALSCEACLAGQFATSLGKQASCRLAPGETLQAPGIFELTRGQRDAKLARREDLEQQFSATSSPNDQA
jgi:hypothetical protein